MPDARCCHGCGCGKYNPSRSISSAGLPVFSLKKSRYADAEKLTRVALDINRTIGVADDAVSSVQLLLQLGSTLIIQRKYGEATAVYADLDKAVAHWDPRQREMFEINESRITSLYNSGRVEAGIAAAERLVKRSVEHVGENHSDTASARGILAVGLMRAKRDADAVREFRTAIPLLMAQSRDNADDDDAAVVAARSQQLQDTVEAYIAMLASRTDVPNDKLGAETFALADAIRGRSVQQALAASSARSSAQDPNWLNRSQRARPLQATQCAARHVEQRLVTGVCGARREERCGSQCIDQCAARGAIESTPGD